MQGDSDASARRLTAVHDVPILTLTPSAKALAKRLIREVPLPQIATADAFHISIAAAHDVKYLLTWNCKHLANATLQSRIRSVVADEFPACPHICTPIELLEDLS